MVKHHAQFKFKKELNLFTEDRYRIKNKYKGVQSSESCTSWIMQFQFYFPKDISDLEAPIRV